MPEEIDTYFDLMDTDHDENLSFKEIEFGYAKFRFFILIYMSLFKSPESGLYVTIS